MAAIANRFLPGSSQTWFTIGGAAATVSVLLLLSGIMGGMPVAGARSYPGLLSQALAGAVAGYVFVTVRPRRKELA